MVALLRPQILKVVSATGPRNRGEDCILMAQWCSCFVFLLFLLYGWCINYPSLCCTIQPNVFLTLTYLDSVYLLFVRRCTHMVSIFYFPFLLWMFLRIMKSFKQGNDNIKWIFRHNIWHVFGIVRPEQTNPRQTNPCVLPSGQQGEPWFLFSSSESKPLLLLHCQTPKNQLNY